MKETIYLKTIEELLEEVAEDKKDNLSTTSFKFKTDLWNFFTNLPDSQKLNCVEFGTHKGQTTRILSHLFKTVYSINLPNHFDQAERLNSDRQNIKFIGMNLYEQPIDENFKHEPCNVFFIDAVHEFDAIMSDFSRSLNLKFDERYPRYFIFDDYGQDNRQVWQVVNQLIRVGRLEKIAYFGHEPNHNFGGYPARILKDFEGIICKLKS
jgi:hypothetical protein